MQTFYLKQTLINYKKTSFFFRNWFMQVVNFEGFLYP